MVKSCCAVGCTNRFQKGGIKFFRLPTNAERRLLWIRALQRKDWQPSKYTYICEEHFQKKEPSMDKNHPDYVPSVFTFKAKKNAESYENRIKRIEARHEKYEAALTLLSLNGGTPVFNSGNEEAVQELYEPTTESTTVEKSSELEDLKKELEALRKKVNEPYLRIASEMAALREENKILRERLSQNDFISMLTNDDDKLKYYTGLCSRGTFNFILSTTKDYVNCNFSLQPEFQLLTVLVRLRLNLQDTDIAHRFNVSRSTVCRIFLAWIPVLAGRLRHLIFWPSRDQIKKNLPKCFKHSAYKNTVCIIDCTELFTQRPSNLTTKSQMWSNYKQHMTLKFLVAITPLGHVCFVSECWGGRVSDKEITLKSKFTEHLKPGDVILADRGFNLNQYFHIKGVELIIPSSTRGKAQLSSSEVLKSKKISNVRIHIERVIGYMKKFHILNNLMPISFIKYIDCVVTVCAAIHNLGTPKVK